MGHGVVWPSSPEHGWGSPWRPCRRRARGAGQWPGGPRRKPLSPGAAVLRQLRTTPGAPSRAPLDDNTGYARGRCFTIHFASLVGRKSHLAALSLAFLRISVKLSILPHARSLLVPLSCEVPRAESRPDPGLGRPAGTVGPAGKQLMENFPRMVGGAHCAPAVQTVWSAWTPASLPGCRGCLGD